MILKKHTIQGSVLVFTLLILAVLLSASLSVASIVVVDRNSVRTTQKSILPFQIAEGAAENILKRVYRNTDSSLDVLASNLYGSATCSGGTISGTLPSGSGTYAVTFLDNNRDNLQCSGSGFNTYAGWRSKLVLLESTGVYAGTTRFLEVGVRP